FFQRLDRTETREAVLLLTLSCTTLNHTSWLSRLSFCPGSYPFVLQCDQAFGKSLVFGQSELSLREPAGKQRYARADQNRNHADIEFIDQVRLQEVANELAAAHQPDVLARTFSYFTNQSRWRPVGERHTVAVARPQLPGKNIRSRLRTKRAAHFLGDIVGLSSHKSGVNAGEEVCHRIVFGHEQKIDVPVATSDVAVQADTEAQDDFTHGEAL